MGVPFAFNAGTPLIFIIEAMTELEAYELAIEVIQRKGLQVLSADYEYLVHELKPVVMAYAILRSKIK